MARSTPTSARLLAGLRGGHLLFALTLTTALARGDAPDFQRDVRPILSQHCFQCHGPDEHGRKGSLRLDQREAALKPAKSGEPAIVPGKVEASELVARIFAHDEGDVMPPPEAKKPLTEAKREILKKWIESGAEYAPHWAFTKPQPAPLPKVDDRHALIRNPIDNFIVAKLDAHGLKQQAPADKATLARRVALDLTGLPPSPEDLAAFLRDESPAAYEAYVDRLLKSPHYGERWARRWLDLARYADTNGYEKDRERSIWPYRDWVIRALNSDMPFDQFTIAQLAGDMLPDATAEQIIATGFHRNTMLNEEGGIDPLEFRFHAMTDRVATTGATWLGLTLQCCQCHTHKFDPIPHTEYYGLMAFLNNADEPDYDLPDAARGRAAQTAEARARQLLDELPGKWPADKGGLAAVPERFKQWLAIARERDPGWQRLRPQETKTNLPLLTVQADGTILGSGDITKHDTYEITFRAPLKNITAIRLQALPHPSLPADGPGLCYYEGPKGDFFMGEFKVTADGQPVKIASATESYAKNNFGKNPATAFAAADGDLQTGWSCAGRYGERHEAVFVFAQPVSAGELKVRMDFGRHYACPLGHFDLAVTTRPQGANARAFDDEVAALLRKPEAALSPAERERLMHEFLLSAPELEAAAAPIRNLRKRAAASVTTLVMRERPPENPRPTFRHHRGEFTQPKEQVQPGTLSALHPFPPTVPKNRLGLARWLVSPENPLTARVVMNRTWAAFFGQGIVRTLDDFGYQGAPPSHPELLDWLALEFIRQGWSIKHMHKLIVMSATYQQSSASSAQAKGAEVDPNNEWLWRFPRTRLDAEIIRDSLLTAAGLLVPKIGGPSVYPPQPDSVTEAAYGKFAWQPSTGPDRYRRSLYTFMKRTAPFGMFSTFDGPAGDACLVKRETSNTPLQALTTLNDIIFTEGAQALGKLIAAQPADDGARIRQLYLRVLQREPAADEAALMLRFVNAQRVRLSNQSLNAAAISGVKSGPAIEPAAWTAASRALFSLDEFVTKN